MSIKNKLVTAVTTAGLLAGLFGSAFVPVANGAWDESDIFSCSTALDTEACETVPDGRITLNAKAYDVTADPVLALRASGTEKVYIKITGATIVAVEAGTSAVAGLLFQYGGSALATTQDWPTNVSSADADGLIEFTPPAADDLETTSGFTVERGTAGSATVSIYHYNDGVKVEIESFSLVWTTSVDGDTIDWTSDGTFVGLLANGGTCNATTDASDVESSYSFEAGDDTTGIDLCISLTNGNGNLITNGTRAANIDVTIRDASGTLDIGADGSNLSDDFESLDTDSNGFEKFDIVSEDDDVTATSSRVTITIEQDDVTLGIETSKTYVLTVIQTGHITSITLVNTAFSLGDGADDDAIEFYGKDAAGNFVPVTLTGTTEMVIDSDFSDAAVMNEAGEEDAQAVFAITESATAARYVSTTAGEKYGEISVNCADADTDKESFTVKVILDDAQTDNEEVVSNTVTIYCALDDSDSMSFVSYAKVGGTATAKVRLLDALGYPVPDGTEVDAITSSGVFAAGAGTNGEEETENGVASFTHLVTGAGVAVMIFSEGANTSLTKSVSYGGAASLNKLNATTVVAGFGADAAGETITFTVEKVSTGKVITATKVANSNGRASYTLGAKRKGRWLVTATYGDEISNSRYVRR